MDEASSANDDGVVSLVWARGRRGGIGRELREDGLVDMLLPHSEGLGHTVRNVSSTHREENTPNWG